MEGRDFELCAESVPIGLGESQRPQAEMDWTESATEGDERKSSVNIFGGR